jgi:hypothetical protein
MKTRTLQNRSPNVNWSQRRMCVKLAPLKLLSALAICASLAGSSSASPRIVHIIGLGATSCSKFIAEITQRPSLQRDYFAWAQGLMSGVVLVRPPLNGEKLDLVSPSFPLLKQVAFLRQYCEKHPSNGFVDAVRALFRVLAHEPPVLKSDK